MRTALLGTGITGAGTARPLARAGHDVDVRNRTRDRAAPPADDAAARRHGEHEVAAVGNAFAGAGA